MRYSPAEKLEIIRLVEESELSVQRSLEELGCRAEPGLASDGYCETTDGLVLAIRGVAGSGLAHHFEQDTFYSNAVAGNHPLASETEARRSLM